MNAAFQKATQESIIKSEEERIRTADSIALAKLQAEFNIRKAKLNARVASGKITQYDANVLLSRSENTRK